MRKITTSPAAVPSTGRTHVERIISITTGEWTRISCECPIGADHTYSDWLGRFGQRLTRIG